MGFYVSIRNHLMHLHNGGLDPATSDPRELRRRRSFAVFVASLAPVAAMLMVSNSYLGASADNPLIAIGMLSIISTLYVQAYLNRRALATNIVILTYWLVVFFLFFDYGLIGTPIFWLFPIPPMAILLNGTKSGIFWCMVSILTLILFWYLEATSIINPTNSLREVINRYLETDSALVFAGDGSIILIVLTITTSVFNRSQLTAEAKLNESVKALKNEVEVRRQAETKAINLEKAKSAFFAAMGHELRTPLNGVIGATQLLQSAKNEAEHAKYTDVIIQSGKTLLELINDVLHLSSLESGKVELEVREIVLDNFMHQTLAPFVLQAEIKSIRFTMRFGDETPQIIYGDPTRLRQVIINLVGNALKFTSHGEVTITVEVENGSLRISVADTGIGIPKNVLPKLFEPYVQADPDTMRKYGGSGLGLAIVSKIISAMQGSISVESTEGKGSVFTFLSPLNNHIEPRIKNKNDPPSQLEPLKIMVVDDNAVNRMVLARMLENANHEVVSLNDGQEALEYAKKITMDLILMDIQMPLMDGLSACKFIRKLNGPNANIPIIAISANFSNEDKNLALSAGMNDYIAKPFRFEEINEKISQCLLSHSA